jgi:hypothetical protein
MEAAVLDESTGWPTSVESNLFSVELSTAALPRRFLARANSLWTVRELILEYVHALPAP